MTKEATSHSIEHALTESIIGGFYATYRALGFGFVEHVYAAALERELTMRGHRVAREVAVPIHYRGEIVAFQRLDMLVDDKVVVEIKSSAKLPPIAERQLYNYLRCTNLEVGLLLHFGHEPKFHRLVHSTALKKIAARRRTAAGDDPCAGTPTAPTATV